jgi:hypothetical protein
MRYGQKPLKQSPIDEIMPVWRASCVQTSKLRAAGAQFQSQSAFRDIFANHSVVDGRLLTGQNQNAGAEVANKMMIIAKGGQK